MNAYERFDLNLQSLNESQLKKIYDLYEAWKKPGVEDSAELLEEFFNTSFSSYLYKYHAEDAPEDDECTEKLFEEFIQYLAEQPSSMPEEAYKSMTHYFLNKAFNKEPAISQDIIDEFSEDLHEIIFKRNFLDPVPRGTPLKEIEKEVEDYINRNEQDLRKELFARVSSRYKHQIEKIQTLEEAFAALNKDLLHAAQSYDALSAKEIHLKESLRQLGGGAQGGVFEEDSVDVSFAKQFTETNREACHTILEDAGLEQMSPQESSDEPDDDHFLTSRLRLLLAKVQDTSQGEYVNLDQLSSIDFATIRENLLQAINIREEKLGALNELVKTKQPQVEELEETVRSKSSQIDKLRMDNRKLQHQIYEMEYVHDEQYSGLKQQHEDQISQNRKLQKELTRLRTVITSEDLAHAEEMAQIKKELEELRGKLGDLVRKNKELEKDSVRLDSGIDKLYDQKTALEKSLAWTKKEMSRLKELMSRKINEQQAMLLSKEDVIAQLNARIQALSEKNDLLQFQLESQLAVQQELPQDDSPVIFRTLADELREVEENEELAALKLELETVKKQFDVYKVDKQKEIGALQKDLLALKQESSAQIARLEQLLHEQQVELQRVKDELQQANAEKEKLKRQVEHGQDAHVQKEEQIQSLIHEIIIPKTIREIIIAIKASNDYQLVHAAAKVKDKSDLLRLNIDLFETLKDKEYIAEEVWQEISVATKQCATERAQELEVEAISAITSIIEKSDNLELLDKIAKIKSNGQLKELGFGEQVNYLLQENAFEAIANIAAIQLEAVREQQKLDKSTPRQSTENAEPPPDISHPKEQNQEVTKQLKEMVHKITKSYKGSDEKREVLMDLWTSVNHMCTKNNGNLSKTEIQDIFRLLTNITLQKQTDYGWALLHRNTTTSGEQLRELINQPQFKALKELITNPDGTKSFTGDLRYRNLRGIASEGTNKAILDNEKFGAKNSTEVSAKFSSFKKQIADLEREKVSVKGLSEESSIGCKL